MKYFMGIIACVALISAGLTGYLYLNSGFMVDSAPNKPAVSPVNPSAEMNELNELNACISKLQDELFNLKNTATQQAFDIAKLTANNSRIDDFYKKLQEIQASLGNKGKSDDSDTQVAPELQANPSEASISKFSPELFNNTEFAKLFTVKVEEAIKQIEEKQREEQAKRVAEQMQKRITQRISDFVKAQNLNEFQQQELTKIILERAAKGQELLAQMRSGSGSDPQLSPEQMRAQMDTIRNESNEKVKQVLLPQQYEEYQKVENSLSGGRGMGRGPERGSTTPSQGQGQGQGRGRQNTPQAPPSNR